MISTCAGKARLVSLCVSLLCAAVPLGALPKSRLSGVAVTDICTLSKGPGAFNGKLVRVQARIVVVVEGAYLSDASSKCIVGLSTPRAVEDDPDIRRATVDAMDAFKDVTGTVTGELLVKRRHHRWVPIVSIIKITNLKVTPWLPAIGS